jgi:hypothetical protein
MISFFTVSGSTGAAPAPKGTQTITARDFNFTIPKKVKGTQTLGFTNKGTQSHELSLLKLNAGVSIDDVKNAFLSEAPPSGPPPFSEAGGVGAIAPGTTAYLNAHLAKGNYVAVCFVPDPATGKPHVELGMLAPFTV